MTLPKRKHLRLEGYDYSTNGAYFATICTAEKRWLFWERPVAAAYNIHPYPSNASRVGADIIRPHPTYQLNRNGCIVKTAIESIPNHYPYWEVDKYVIMPNHIHLIIIVHNKMVQAGGTSRTPSPTNAVIPAFISTLKRMVNREIGCNIWQRSYNDHILRNEADYLQHWQYIDENPMKWESDEHYMPL